MYFSTFLTRGVSAASSFIPHCTVFRKTKLSKAMQSGHTYQKSTKPTVFASEGVKQRQVSLLRFSHRPLPLFERARFKLAR